MNKKIIKDTLILFVITLISGILLGGAYYITKEPIEQKENEKKMQAYERVLTDAKKFIECDVLNEKEVTDIEKKYNATIESVVKGQNTEGKDCGYVITVNTHEGYGGDIIFTLGISSDGIVSGLEIISISETANIGMKADTDEFKGQFAGKSGSSITYVTGDTDKSDEISGISGATITTKAVTGGVNAALELYTSILNGGEAHE